MRLHTPATDDPSMWDGYGEVTDEHGRASRFPSKTGHVVHAPQLHSRLASSLSRGNSQTAILKACLALNSGEKR